MVQSSLTSFFFLFSLFSFIPSQSASLYIIASFEVLADSWKQLFTCTGRFISEIFHYPVYTFAKHI